jgi:hypothetical protein
MRTVCRVGRRGSAATEFAFSLLVLVPAVIGVFVMGFRVTDAIQTVQVARDTARMSARGIDFSVTANQDLVVRLSSGLNMTRTGGEGVVIISKVLLVGHDQCQAGGLSDAACTNINLPVFIRRIVIGNSGLRASNHGTPSPGLIDSSGYVSNYLTNTTTRAVGGFSALMPNMVPGDEAFMAEAYFASPGSVMFGSAGSYSRSIF